MPVSIGAATATDQVKEWRKDFGDDGDLNVTFDVSGLTPAVEAQLRAAFRSPDDADPLVLARFLASIVTEWDLLDDDGDVIPTTAEAISEVPYGILMLVWEGLQEVSGVGEPSGGT